MECIKTAKECIEKNGHSFSCPKKWIITGIFSIQKNKTIKEAQEFLKKNAKMENTDELFITDENEKLVGTLQLNELFNYPENTVLEKIMNIKIFSITPKTDPAKIAHLALKHGSNTIPVTEKGKLVGFIPSKNIAYIIKYALRKDLLHFAGIHKAHLDYENSLTVPLSKSIEHRVPWLIIGLFGVILIAGFMGVFEEVLKKHIMLAFFVPAIVYMSGSLCAQIQAILIRDLAVLGEELNMKKYVLRQLTIALLISIIIGTIMFASVSFFWNNTHIAFVISLSTIASLMLTGALAMGITLALKKKGFDPALGSGPIATVISDAASIVIYFIVIVVLL
jgi:magnesium transporter